MLLVVSANFYSHTGVACGRPRFLFMPVLFVVLLTSILVVKTTNFETQTSMDTGVWFPILFNIMSDSVYVSVGVAVRYNCQTARLWRLRVSPLKPELCGDPEADLANNRLFPFVTT